METKRGELDKKRKTLLITMQDGSMYRFSFDFLLRETYADNAFNALGDNKTYHYELNNKINISSKYTKVRPNHNVEIIVHCDNKTYIQYIGMASLAYEKALLRSHTYSAGLVNWYIDFPLVINDFEEAEVISKNWSINFMKLFLEKDDYSVDLMREYSYFWRLKSFSKKNEPKLGISSIEWIK